jgi:hypothetical protein
MWHIQLILFLYMVLAAVCGVSVDQARCVQIEPRRVIGVDIYNCDSGDSTVRKGRLLWKCDLQTR